MEAKYIVVNNNVEAKYLPLTNIGNHYNTRVTLQIIDHYAPCMIISKHYSQKENIFNTRLAALGALAHRLQRLQNP